MDDKGLSDMPLKMLEYFNSLNKVTDESIPETPCKSPVQSDEHEDEDEKDMVYVAYSSHNKPESTTLILSPFNESLDDLFPSTPSLEKFKHPNLAKHQSLTLGRIGKTQSYEIMRLSYNSSLPLQETITNGKRPKLVDSKSIYNINQCTVDIAVNSRNNKNMFVPNCLVPMNTMDYDDNTNPFCDNTPCTKDINMKMMEKGKKEKDAINGTTHKRKVTPIPPIPHLKGGIIMASNNNI